MLKNVEQLIDRLQNRLVQGSEEQQQIALDLIYKLLYMENIGTDRILSDQLVVKLFRTVIAT